MKNIWKELVDITNKSQRNINIVSGNDINGREECIKLNIPSDTLLYSIVFNSNVIVVDNWIRIFGQKSYNNKGIFYYNNSYKEYISGMILVASDVVGGLFAINITRYNDENLIWYFAPDTLEWECLDMKYSEFVTWAFLGNIDEFYSSMRWKNWEKDIEGIDIDKAMLVYPFLWAKECDIENATKKIVDMEEIIRMNFDYSNRF